MGVLVLLEMDGATDALLASAADLEERRPTPASVGGPSGRALGERGHRLHVLGVRRGARALSITA